MFLLFSGRYKAIKENEKEIEVCFKVRLRKVIWYLRNVCKCVFINLISFVISNETLHLYMF